MAIIIFQPQGSGTTHKEGTIVVQAPKAATWGSANYVIDDHVTNLPTTGTINANLSGRFDDTTYYTA
jgi:hypothetical protein